MCSDTVLITVPSPRVDSQLEGAFLAVSRESREKVPGKNRHLIRPREVVAIPPSLGWSARCASGNTHPPRLLLKERRGAGWGGGKARGRCQRERGQKEASPAWGEQQSHGRTAPRPWAVCLLSALPAVCLRRARQCPPRPLRLGR